MSSAIGRFCYALTAFNDSEVYRYLIKTNGSQRVFIRLKEGAKKLSEKYGFEYVAASLRKSRSASANDYSAMIYSRSENVVYHSREYAADPIVDRVGTGDAFSAGVLCGLLDGKDYRDALEFGVAAAVLKHTVPGDFNCITRGEAEALAGGCGSLKVQR